MRARICIGSRRQRGAVGVELLIRGPRYAVREFVQLGGLGLQKAFEDSGLR